MEVLHCQQNEDDLTFLPQQPPFLCGGIKLELAHLKTFKNMRKTLCTLPPGSKVTKKLHQGRVAPAGKLKIKINEDSPAE